MILDDPTRWTFIVFLSFVSSWSTRHQQACSTRCGDGYKRVIYECVKSSSTNRVLEPMDENVCRKYVGEKPKDVVSCVGDCTGTGWVYGNWGEVSSLCATLEHVEHRFCSLPVPS